MIRITENWHTGWRFHMGEAVDAFYKGYDDDGWLPVTVPHDWAVSQPFDVACSSGSGYLPGGIGWYRRHFDVAETADRHFELTFLGVYKHARVWVNSNYVGTWAYGYSTFTMDITPFVKPGDNVVCVRCEHNDLADSRWFTGNGIYRDVRLTVTGVNRFVNDGVFARTVSADEKSAQIEITAEIAGSGAAEYSLEDASGATVASGSGALTVASPTLWSPEQPYLYTLRCRLVSGGEVCDELAVPFGIRTLRFDADKGFFLNGKPMKLNGVCLHHDAGVLGAAVPPSVWEERFKSLMESGCNALRFAHNPPDPLLLDVCDRLGLLVMDEAFDEWEGCKNKWWQGHNVYPPKHFGYSEDYPEWHERDLSALVRRDRNHACVIMWSIGNEVDYPNDPYVHPLFESMTGNNDANKPAAERRYNPDKPNAERLVTIAQELAAIVRRSDATRPVTAALAFPELSVQLGMAEALDVVGFNYKEHLYAQTHAEHPEYCLLGSENSHSAEAWHAVRDNEYISGQFLWTGADFLGECPGWPYRISQAGMLDLCGNKKARWWHRRAMWLSEPVVRLAVAKPEREWDECFVWSGKPGEDKLVYVLTNAPRAELFLNGASLGAKDTGDEFMACWTVPYAAGELSAKAYFSDCEKSDALRTPGDAVALRAGQANVKLPADGHSTARIELTLVDAEGGIAGADDRMVRCQVTGDVDFTGMENGNPCDVTCYALSTRSTYHGCAVVYLRAGTEAGVAQLRLKADGLDAITVNVELV